MKSLWRAAVIFFACSALPACGTDEDLSTQRTAIERFLSNQEGEYTLAGGTYRYVVNQDRAGYATAAEAASGDIVSFLFQIREFTSSPAPAPFFSNDPEVIAGLGLAANDLNTEYWEEGPMEVKVGSTPLVDGLAQGLAGCRSGDSTLLIMTSDMAFADHDASTLPKNTAIVYLLYDIEVTKQ